jgi:hypothetical protein
MKICFVISTLLLSLVQTHPAEAESAWVWANAQKNASYTANAQFSHNPAGGEIHIKRNGPGKYELHFAELGAAAKTTSNVQVSSYGAGSNSCKVAGWSPSGKALTIRVNCFTASGTPADALFSALISYEKQSASKAAYAWSSKARASHRAPEKFVSNFNQPVQIKRIGLGQYKAVFVGLGRKTPGGGNVQVTAYGPKSQQCKVKDWRKTKFDFVANVRCFAPSGSPADAQFSILVTFE